jgi:hypothetical protein
MSGYEFSEEPVEVGLAVKGCRNLLGPIVLSALFIPSDRSITTLSRYDLFSGMSSCHQRKNIGCTEFARYSKLLSLNKKELGYVVKSIDSQKVCNYLLSEDSGRSHFDDLILKYLKKLMVFITKKLRLKVSKVIFYHTTSISSVVLGRLAACFPHLDFLTAKHEKYISVKDISNAANMLANMYATVEVIWKHEFPELAFAPQESAIKANL